jgi:hypothetical protein
MSVRQAVFDLIDAFVPVEQQESEDFGYPPEMPLRHRAAYCAALHSGSACFAAASEDRYEYAGDRCAWALISAFLDAENPVSRKEFDCSPLWDIAQSAIVRAQEFGAVEYG